MAVCAAGASVLAAGCVSGSPGGSADARSRIGVTTVSFRDRYSMRLGSRTTPGTDSYLNAPQFVRDNLGLRNLEVWNIQFEASSYGTLKVARSPVTAKNDKMIGASSIPIVERWNGNAPVHRRSNTNNDDKANASPTPI